MPAVAKYRLSELEPTFLCHADMLELSLTLNGGQTFSWHRIEGPSEVLWITELDGIPVIMLQRTNEILYHTIPSQVGEMKTRLWRYFRLDQNLYKLCDDWSRRDLGHFGRLPQPPIRWLKQDPTETLFAFICSQNNGIKRINQMVLELRRSFGKHLFDIDMHTDIVSIHSFPKPSDLAEASVIPKLTVLRFGYRARYIQQAAQHLIDNPVAFSNLPHQEYDHAHRWLCEVPGVGPKVADCITLFGLGLGHVVPVDVHMWRLATRQYGFVSPKQKTLTPTVHRMIGGQFRELFGPLAGWAHLILFAAQRQPQQSKKTK